MACNIGEHLEECLGINSAKIEPIQRYQRD